MSSTTVTADVVGEMRASLRETARAKTYGQLIWVLTLLPPLALMIGVAVQPWVAPGDLLRDPLAVAETIDGCCKVYHGAISSLGVLLWASATAVCLFAAFVLYTLARPMAEVGFMASAGLLTGLFTIDDLFLVHDNVLPAFGVAQPVTYAAYGLCGIIYLLLSWRQILKCRYGLLAVAIALLAVSVVVDSFFHSDNPARILIEDGAKFGGIFAWVSFHATAAWQLLVRSSGAVR